MEESVWKITPAESERLKRIRLDNRKWLRKTKAAKLWDTTFLLTLLDRERLRVRKDHGGKG